MEVWLLHVRYERSRDEEDLAALVEEYDRYALSLAYRMRREHELSDDLAQVAREALILALNRFECSRGLPFTAFATPTILGALRRHYRDHGWSIRVPRRAHEVAVPAREAADRLTTELGRAPSEDEVARAIDVSPDELRMAQRASAARTPLSLDASSAADSLSSHETVGQVDRNLIVADEHLDLANAVTLLDDRDREVIGLYFFDELTQSQIAARFGVSQMQVSRWLSSSLARLRARMTA